MKVLLFIATVIFALHRVEGLTCLQCKGVPKPLICNKVVDCYAGESCSVEQVLNEFGEIVYNLGCLPNTVCNNFTNSINGQRVTCSECCNSKDLCNSKGCSQQGYPEQRGPICYNCPLHTDSGKCHNIEFCSTGEVCNIVGKNMFSETVYTSSCISKHACKPMEGSHVAIIGKRDVSMDKRSHEQHICDSCCSEDLCNKNCTTAQLSIDPCQSNPCNHGTCKSDGHNFRCECAAGFTGIICDTDIDECLSNPCRHGTCSDRVNGYVCVCTQGYSGNNCQRNLTDCADILRHGNNKGDGIYTISTWKTHETIDIYCDMTTDGGGWTVFQYRFNYSVDFNRNFSQYENGFGNLHTEFWLGLKYIEEIANQGLSDLRMDVEAQDGATAYETFDRFSLSSGPAYTLHLGSTIASHKISNNNRFGPYHNGFDFSTADHDVDNSTGNCAVQYKGGWWYRYCFESNLNGVKGTRPYGIIYNSFISSTLLKGSRMMMRSSLPR